MRTKVKLIVFLFLGLVLLHAPKAEAFIVINELLADPAAGAAGDANKDGTTSSTQDEFAEILNDDTNSADLSGWSLSDASLIRHVFPAASILAPYQYLVIFGGGSPGLPGVFWQKASTGTLSLNNTGETVTLRNSNGDLIDQIIYGNIANQDQSIVRLPEGSGTNFVLHTSLLESKGTLFSPGTNVSGQPMGNAPVPELPALIYFGLGMVFVNFYRKYTRNLN